MLVNATEVVVDFEFAAGMLDFLLTTLRAAWRMVRFLRYTPA
jgi:hypothetical protein